MIDFTEWQQYEEAMLEIGDEFPRAQERFLRQVGREIEVRLFSRASQHSDSGSWMSSFETIVGQGENGRPTLHMGHVDDGADGRLPIYWKVLERGAAPNPVIPPGAIMAWSRRVTGSTFIGMNVIMRNRAGLFGIHANPIVSFSFELDSELNPIGLTSESAAIWEDALVDFGNQIVETWNTATGKKRVKVRRQPKGARGPAGEALGGRFVPL